jgi:hypothetical protein
MQPLDGLEEWKCVTLKHPTRPCLLLYSMPYKPMQYRVITVASPPGGTDKHPVYMYCQYISSAVAHNNKHCTYWDWECTEIVSPE